MLTKEKVIKALQTLPTTFTPEELLEQLLYVEGETPNGIKATQKEAIAEAEVQGPSENFKEWASLA
ncbi:MAG: hypothetical protein HRU41_39305 [Saprospiraceae bacterium]|nr:hypothetical protein [Saprospiraceae bacterium]